MLSAAAILFRHECMSMTIIHERDSNHYQECGKILYTHLNLSMQAGVFLFDSFDVDYLMYCCGI